MPPLDGAAHAHAEAFAFGRRHVNPVLIFGITLFGLGAVYLALVVALRAQPILFPGQQPGLGPLAPPKLHAASAPASTTPSKTLRHISQGRYTPRKRSTSLAPLLTLDRRLTHLPGRGVS